MANENNRRLHHIDREAVLSELIGIRSTWRSARHDMPDHAVFCWEEMKRGYKRLRAMLPDDPDLTEKIEDGSDVQQVLWILDELKAVFDFDQQEGAIFFGPDSRQDAVIRDAICRFSPRKAVADRGDGAANGENSANTSKLFSGKVPANSDLVDLAVRLDAEKGEPESERRQLIEIARKFTGETKGDDAKSRSLLSQLRRMKREGRINL